MSSEETNFNIELNEFALAEEDTGPRAQQPDIQDGNGDVEGAETTSQSNLLRVGIIVLGLLFVGAIAWASTMTSRYISESSNKDRVDRSEPLVIVGGGAGGTYLAWRLASSDDSSKPYAADEINLYERSDHISGRVFSPTIGESLCTNQGSRDETDLPRTELGGMRIRENKDKILLGVVEQLGIKTAPFYMNAQNISSNESFTNPVFGRNVLGTRFDFMAGNMLPFTSTQEIPGLNLPSFDDPPDRPSINNDDYDPCDFEANVKILMQPYGPTGSPYYTWSSSEDNHFNYGETRDMAQYGGTISGYSIENYNLGSATGGAVLPATPYNYTRPLKGMQEIPLSLDRAARALGTKTSLNKEVTRVELANDGGWYVTLMPTTTSKCTGITKVVKDAKPEVVKAERVILALPAAALDRIQFVTPENYGSLQRIITRLTGEPVAVPLMKLFAAWTSQWWETVKPLDVFSKTAMPFIPTGGESRNTSYTCGRYTNDVVNQVFAWYPGTQSRPETIEKNANACSGVLGVLQLYIMPNIIPIYEAAAEGRAQEACDDDESCKACNISPGNEGWFSNGISTRLLKQVTQDMSTLFRRTVVNPSEIKYHIWDRNDPVTRSEGVHFWKAGVKWWESYSVALEPLHDSSSIHLIGETFSHNQGWVEGALETAEHLLQEVLNVARPNWLDPIDYCRSMPFYTKRSSIATPY